MKWETVRLEECCCSISDGDHQPPPKSEKGVPFVTISDITDTNQFSFENTAFVPEEYYNHLDAKRKAAAGDILYSVVGSFGIPVLIQKQTPLVFQRHIAILKPNETIVDPRFLYYTMLSREFYAKADAVAIGAAQRTISLSALRNIKVSLPELSVQHKIADTLSAYDALIENNQRQIKLLEEAAQRLYKEWFVDLHFPDYESTPIVDGVPEGWKASLISDICETVGGGTPSTKVAQYYENGGIPWVTPTDITRSYSLTLLDTATKITKAGFEHSSTKMLPPETILMTSRASVGYFGIFEYEVCTNQGFIACIPNNSESQMFLLYNLMNRVDEIRRKASGSTYLEISKKTFRELEIIIPDSSTLKRFQEIAHKYLDRIRMLTKTISKLKQARDCLLSKLMSGELEV